jgi:hypothetical protein
MIAVLRLKCNKWVFWNLFTIQRLLCSMSSNVGKQIAIFGLIVIQLGASVFMPFSHQHVLYGRSDRPQNIQSHDCGTNEVHRALDDSCHCLLCLRDASSIGIQAFSSINPRTCAEPLMESAATATPANSEFFSEPERGPPAFSA